MAAKDKPAFAEREQTDESLRVEREKADIVLGDEGNQVDGAADAVIEKARRRADEVLAAARAKTDQRPAGSAATAIIERDRAREDRNLRQERAGDDETVRVERAEHAALLATEREETDRDLLTERSRSDSAVATRDEFLSIVSHDLRNMLGGVAGFASAIEESATRQPNLEQISRWAQRIQRSAARMNRLVGDLVDVASIEQGRLGVTREVGDPCLVVSEALEASRVPAATRQVALTAEIVPPVMTLAFDPARILQVLTNLLGNAIKFTPPHGRVVVRCEALENEVRFSVSDTGVGIPPDKLEAVFERFTQVKHNDQRGVGLGLYICRCIVEGHDGRIWAESTVGEGTTISFTLPLHPPERTAAGIPSSHPSHPAG